MKYLKYDIEKIIDDFILICFFIGNDFLPRGYCFDIRQGNFEALIDSFKNHLKTSKAYINNYGIIDF